MARVDRLIAVALDAVTSSLDDFLSFLGITPSLACEERAHLLEWQSIESLAEKVFTYKEIERKLPAKLEGVKPDSPQVYKYLNEHKWELEYQLNITGEDHSLLAFAQHSIKQMNEKLRIYDQLLEIQQKTGGANTVVLIAIGTLIWLLS